MCNFHRSLQPWSGQERESFVTMPAAVGVGRIGQDIGPIDAGLVGDTIGCMYDIGCSPGPRTESGVFSILKCLTQLLRTVLQLPFCLSAGVKPAMSPQRCMPELAQKTGPGRTTTYLLMRTRKAAVCSEMRDHHRDI